MSKFVFYKTVPDEVRAAAESHLLPLEWALPDWCRTVNVGWRAEGGEDEAGQLLCVTTSFEYRNADLTVGPLFLSATEEMRADACLHEIIHLHVGPLFNYADRTIKVLTAEDAKQQTILLEEARRYNEGVTQDLTNTIFRRLYATPEG